MKHRKNVPVSGLTLAPLSATSSKQGMHTLESVLASVANSSCFLPTQESHTHNASIMTNSTMQACATRVHLIVGGEEEEGEEEGEGPLKTTETELVLYLLAVVYHPLLPGSPPLNQRSSTLCQRSQDSTRGSMEGKIPPGRNILPLMTTIQVR